METKELVKILRISENTLDHHAADQLESKDAEIAKLRAALTTTRLYIEDEMIAHAIMPDEAGRIDPRGQSLLQKIDAALGTK